MTEPMQAGGLMTMWLMRSLAIAFGRAMPADQKIEFVIALQKERMNCLIIQATATAPEQEPERVLMGVVGAQLEGIINSISEEPEKPAEG